MEDRVKLDYFPSAIDSDLRTMESSTTVHEWSKAVVCHTPDLKLGSKGVRRYAKKN